MVWMRAAAARTLHSTALSTYWWSSDVHMPQLSAIQAARVLEEGNP